MKKTNIKSEYQNEYELGQESILKKSLDPELFNLQINNSTNESIKNEQKHPFLSTKYLKFKITIIIVFWGFIIFSIFHIFNTTFPFFKELIEVLCLAIASGLTIYHWFFKKIENQLNVSRIENIKLSKIYSQRLEAINQSAILTFTDPKGQILYANDLFCKISGYDKSELIGKNHRILKSDIHASDFYKHMWKTILSGQIWSGEICNKRKNGELYWVRSTIVPIFDSENKIKEFFGIRFDISKEKEIKKAMQDEQIKNIHSSNVQFMNEIAAGIGHEINNPLTVISALVYKIKKMIRILNLPENDTENFNKEFIKIDNHIQRILKIIYGLKAFTETDNNGHFIYFDCETIIEDIINICRDIIEQRGIELRLSIQKLNIFCNPTQIEQVLMNLIRNSIQAISSSDENKWIHISTQLKNNYVQISIVDSGNGISESITDKILQPFFTTKPAGNGIGLGLTISNNLVHANNGRLYLDKKNPNTCFVIELPSSPEQAHEFFDIDKEVTAHLDLRHKLIQAILLDDLKNLNEITDSKICALGSWIEKNKELYSHSTEFKELKQNHNLFHFCAVDIIRRYKNGESKLELIKSLDVGSNSEFDRISNELSVNIKKLKPLLL